MKIVLVTFWCLIPLGLLAYHFGPGQEGVVLDQVSASLEEAKAHTEAESWSSAIASYEQALAKLPKERESEGHRIRLELAKARMQESGLPQAREELAGLVQELEADPTADPATRDEAIAALATARFYMTYLMKLEGQPESEWEPEIEAARQEQKLLVQRSREAGDEAAAAAYADELESSILLARMDPTELYGKAIPKQCQNCKSGKKPGTKPASKPSTKPEDNRGASAGAPMDGEGS